MNNQLERIADYIDAGKAGGGSLTVNLSGVGDMTGASAGTAGAHGLVPAPSAGDNEKYLTGAGTWEAPQGGGGVDYSLSEQDTGLKWIDNKTVYQQTIYVQSTTSNPYDWVQVGNIPNIETVIKSSIVAAYGALHNAVVSNSNYLSCRVDNDTGNVYYYCSQLGNDGLQHMYITIQYTKQ